MRFVLDVNVFVSGLLSRSGAPAQLLKRWLDGDFELVVSEQLLDELERTLAAPKIRKRIASEDAEHAITCDRSSFCTVNVLWVRIRDAIAGTLDAMTLADLVPSPLPASHHRPRPTAAHQPPIQLEPAGTRS